MFSILLDNVIWLKHKYSTQSQIYYSIIILLFTLYLFAYKQEATFKLLIKLGVYSKKFK